MQLGKRTMKRITSFFAALGLILASSAMADQGVTATQIRFAQVAPFENGPIATATSMQTGIRAAFDEVNKQGGIQGRMLTLDSFDDSYEPGKTLVQVRKLIEQNAHIGLIGLYGTATGAASQPLATAADWPYISPVTGADFLRDPDLKNVFNVRQTYANEMVAGTRYLIDTLGFTKIAVMYQDDGYGRAGRSGVLRALEDSGLAPVAEAKYVRNTTAVKVGTLNIRNSGAEAVLFIGVSAAAQTFIETAYELNYHPKFVNISLVGSQAFADNLGEAAKGVIVTQVVPFPTDPSVPIVADYQAAMKAMDPNVEFDFISLEGYIAGRIAIRGLRRAGPDLSRAAYLSALQNLGSFDLNGVPVSYGPGDNQGLTEVFVTEMDGAGALSVLATKTVAD